LGYQLFEVAGLAGVWFREVLISFFVSSILLFQNSSFVSKMVDGMVVRGDVDFSGGREHGQKSRSR
jgi:hypothetical protein